MESVPPPEPTLNGDTEMTDASAPSPAPAPTPTAAEQQPQQPPLGRHASTGDSQPTLGDRQISEGIAETPVPPTLTPMNGDSAMKEEPKEEPTAEPPAAAPVPEAPAVAMEEPMVVDTPEVAPPVVEPIKEAPAEVPTEPAPPVVPQSAGAAAAEASSVLPPKVEAPPVIAQQGIAVPLPAVEKVEPTEPQKEEVEVPPPAPAPEEPKAEEPEKPAETTTEPEAAPKAEEQAPAPAPVPAVTEVSTEAALAPVPAAEAAVAAPPEATEAVEAAPPAAQPAVAPQAAASPAAAEAPRPPAPPMRELRVEDALLYLDDVKREFGDRPRVYNEFLAIMKNFKSQEVDTPGVIQRVSKLFRGYNNLILGFNKFLPEGYKISLADLEEADALYAKEQEELRRQAAMAGAAGITRPTVAGVPGMPGFGMSGVAQPTAPMAAAQNAAALPAVGATPMEVVRRSPVDSAEAQRPLGPPGLGQYPMQQQPAPAVPQAGHALQVQASPQAVQAQPQAQQQVPQQQAVEFDHAISYVTTIKRRFANDPNIYHAFLEILHTYQKEQRGIKEVLEQVAHLFQDHPDLLKEFTFFLPDAVQEQAKERLHRAAADSEARQAAKRAQLEQHQRGDSMDIDGKHRLIDMTGRSIMDQDGRGRKRSHKSSGGLDASQQIVLPQQPESYVYNSAVERQFFDAAREALAAYTRDGGQAWAEFLKCLDMYAQEILSRSEMLNFVEPLLGKRNNKLFEEFKRIVNSAGGSQTNSAPSMEDSWYSVPLSEIDFSRCRRCSPSYRALPRDYPSPPCSDRNEEEAKVLNDVWVSLPVGSEESYTFRHMRRNTYEETLFRCEDERFEIDMVIDSNAVTLARLEPIAEEIGQLAENELIMPETSNVPRPATIDHGMAGKRFQYTFDKTILGVIHRNSISRIYGDAGPEMLELIVKNPTVAIQVVVERLRQKDTEWRKVRSRLNKRWKELAEHNYYRSLDHRSLTWRTTDKRAISTRTLLSEIKDRAAHNGHESAASLQARLDKMKEEHGSFFQVTMGPTMGKKMDLTTLPKPDRRLFTPHMSFMYENTSWVHRDVYRILSFALERGSTSPADKERCHRLWFDFLGPWFNLTVDWMMTPAVTFQETTRPVVPNALPRIVSNGDESMADEDEEESVDDDGIAARVVTEDVRGIKQNDKQTSPSYMDHHPLPAGATVSTLYGDGRIIECRRSDDTYVVELAFGKAFLRPSAVLCSIIPAEKSAYTSQLRAEDRTKLERPADMLAIGTQSLYLFFRLHQILVERLCVAKKLAYSVKDDQTLQNMVEQMPGEDAAGLGRRRYDAFLGLVYALLDGGQTISGSAAEGGKYEDRVRTLLGHGGYALATMDKLISHIMKNLQSMANDDTMWNLIQLYRRHLDSGSFKPEAFRMEAGYLSDGEQMYAFQMCPVQKEGGDKSIIHMEYLGVISESEGEDASMADSAPEPPQPKRQRRDR